MVEIGGLGPPTPYMRSRETVRRGACCIRVFGSFRHFLPIALPTEDRVKDRLHGDLCLIAKIVRDLDGGFCVVRMSA